jgi:hypothetical protein
MHLARNLATILTDKGIWRAFVLSTNTFPPDTAGCHFLVRKGSAAQVAILQAIFAQRAPLKAFNQAVQAVIVIIGMLAIATTLSVMVANRL